MADIRWGKNKDNPKLKNTCEAYVYSLTTHQPIYYRLLPGNSSDISSVRSILADLRALKITDIILIADRGYISEENIAKFIYADIPFIICAKINSRIISKYLKEIKYYPNGHPINMEFNRSKQLFFAQFEIEPYITKINEDTEVEIKGLKANLFLNLKQRMIEICEIYDKVNEEKKILKEDLEKNNIPSDIKKYNALFEYFKISPLKNEKKQPIGFNFTEDTEKINREILRCGFFASLMYNLNISAEEALDRYGIRDEHEKNFNILKNQMNYDVQKNSSEDGKNGRTFIAFVGLICISELNRIWKENFRDNYSSTLEMLDEMSSIRFSEYTDGSTHMTTFTMSQVEICKSFEIEPPYECLPQTLKKNYFSKK